MSQGMSAYDQFDQYDNEKEKKWKLPFKKRWLFLGILVAAVIACVILVFHVMPRKDKISTADLPVSYIIENENNYVAYQRRGDCAGFSTAYVMRHLGVKAEGAALYDEMSQFFGSVAMHNIVGKLNDYGLKGRMYYGSIDTLKAELNKGVPVIALIKIVLANETGKHYVAVVGYDEEYIYMADSTEPKTNIYGNKMYNRKVTYSEFEDLWKTGSYPCVENCYIVVENNGSVTSGSGNVSETSGGGFVRGAENVTTASDPSSAVSGNETDSVDALAGKETEAVSTIEQTAEQNTDISQETTVQQEKTELQENTVEEQQSQSDTTSQEQVSAPWYYTSIPVRTYAASEKAEQVSAAIQSIGSMQITGESYAGGEDTESLIAISERFADLTENTFERKQEEVADWCYLSIGECWDVIDTWNKQSELVAYQIEGIYYESAARCTVDIIEIVNDNYNEDSGLYDGTFGRTGMWRGHLHYELRENGWFLASENYDKLHF